MLYNIKWIIKIISSVYSFYYMVCVIQQTTENYYNMGLIIRTQ